MQIAFTAQAGREGDPDSLMKKAIAAAQRVAVASMPIADIHTIPYSGIVPTILVMDQKARISPTRIIAANTASKRRLFALNTRVAGTSSNARRAE
jgi:hypothetical protein